MIISCSYFGADDFYEYNVSGVKGESESSKQEEWNENFYSSGFERIVLNFLNNDYFPLTGIQIVPASIVSKNWDAYSENNTEGKLEQDGSFIFCRTDKIYDVIKERQEIIKNDLTRIENKRIRLLIDYVLLSDYDTDLTCIDKLALYHVLEGSTKALKFKSVSSFEFSFADDFSKCSGLGMQFRKKAIELKKQNKDKFEVFEGIKEIVQEGARAIPFISHKFSSFSDMIIFFITEMIRLNISVKKCENCSKYFVPSRSNSKYCDNESPQDKEKKCQEYMKYMTYINKNRTDEPTRLYRQIYNSLANKSRRFNKGNKSLLSKIEDFKRDGDKWRADIKSGRKTNQEFIAWLENFKDRKWL